ncbi:hypothetical protein LPJ53_002368 [Coemansia erecta]|uniref:6-pyruvoyltetrahydropterin synthase n=1 Tax=Coemansia erecta TaxID=147472 RepID=A0A9W7Y4E8_9FUNG|nr:hypothetical protein LPJ53_002368 [Coemansia erecta]
MPAIAYVSRTEHFSAAHRLHSLHLSDEENRQVYGNCNHASGHGHNYVLETIFRGPIDPETGMVVNISDVKQWIKTAVLDVVDHRNLDADVAFFKKRTSTIENLAVFIWARLLQQVPEGLLYKVIVSETPKNKVEFCGDGLTAADIDECIV